METETELKPISFRDNMAGNFGEVLRSSGIFYYRYGVQSRTTISFMNYWKYKRDLSVSIVASLRSLDGKLIRRERLEFDKGDVINFRPTVAGADSFEGSVEIEVFSLRNMVIPYAAIMAVYETARGISAVHTYGRVYSNHEIEEGRTITDGEEGCWTLRDSREFRSFAVVHNGNRTQPEQIVELKIRNHRGEIRSAMVPWPALAPYATVKLVPENHIGNLVEFLEGQEGFATLSYKLTAFTRMLVGNEARDGSDLQVTHSNFNYAKHATDRIDETGAKAFMFIPDCGMENKKVIVYPEMDKGTYKVALRNETYSIESGSAKIVEIDGRMNESLEFSKVDGPLPTRIVTSIAVDQRRGLVPSECSLGVLTSLQPPKRLWWGLASAGGETNGKLVIHDLPEIYGGMPADGQFSIRLVSSARSGFQEKTFSSDALAEFSEGVPFAEIFANAADWLANDFGYYTVYSDYGGLSAYSTLSNKHGSFCLEHGF